MATSADLHAARAAYASRAWREAYDGFSRADRLGPLGGADLRDFAVAASLAGHEDRFQKILERAHEAFAQEGANRDAARCAFWLGFRMASRGEVGPATGWLGRATRLVEREGAECVEQGYLLVPVGYERLMAGDGEAAWEAASKAAAIGERFDDSDLLTLALHLQGRARLHQSRVAEGLALLDEAMVGVSSRRLSPHVTGLVYCSMIGACRSVYDLERANQWTAALGDWCREQPELVAFSGECIAYQAEILNLRGDWRGAIRETRRVCEAEDYRDQPAAVAAAFYQRGEARRLLGELDAAEDDFRSASRLGREPQPGLALLRLAQGEPAAAAAALKRALGEARDPLQRARLLPALCEVHLALGEIDDSERACDELEDIARRVASSFLVTMAHAVRGATLLARGDAGAALRPLRDALDGWRANDAPYEAARTRALIARACEQLGDRDSAALERDAARRAFDALGAAATVLRVDGEASRPDAATTRHGLTPREAEVLAVVATGKSNRATASALGISEKTVARHLSNIFGKLGLSSRAAATAYAYEHDLIEPSA